MNQLRECEDVNECTRYGSNVCSPDTSECHNTLGSYECVCKKGFEDDGSGRFCKDINECESSDVCDHKCFNTFGSYQCVCDNGFKLSDDMKSCIDVDECQLFEEKKTSSNLYLCIGICDNTVGSYQCSCPHGYRLANDKRTCFGLD
jgi:fibulin 1/2